MTTSTNVSNNTNANLLSGTSFAKGDMFNYSRSLAEALKGDRGYKQHIQRIIAELSLRSTKIQEKIANFPVAERYEHKGNQGNIRRHASNLTGILNMLRSVNAGTQDLSTLNDLVSHNVLSEPHFGQFSYYDLDAFLVGRQLNVNAARDRGISNFPMPGYVDMSAVDQGIMLQMNDEQIIVSSTEAFRLLCAAFAPTNEGHYQKVAYSQMGVFPTTWGKVNYDGCTIVLHDGCIITDITGQEHHFTEALRFVMNNEFYTIIMLSTAYAQGMGAMKYILHASITEMLHGTNNVLPENRLRFAQWWCLYTLRCRSNHDVVVMKTAAEQEICFESNKYHTNRHLTCEADILNFGTFSANFSAYEQERAEIESTRSAKAAPAAVVVAEPVVVAETRKTEAQIAAQIAAQAAQAAQNKAAKAAKAAAKAAQAAAQTTFDAHPF